MKALGNKVYIKRGEDFVLKIGNHKTEPLVIPSSYAYPFIIVALRSTKYHQDKTYTSVRWLDCRNAVKFDNPDIQYIGIDTLAVSLTNDPSTVYCVTDATMGEKSYYYYKKVVSVSASDNQEHVSYDKSDYSFKFKVHYDTDETSELVDRQYIGEVHLVDGEPMSTYLFALVAKYNLTLSKQTMTAAYNALVARNVRELDGLDVNRPLNNLSVDKLLLKFDLFVEV